MKRLIWRLNQVNANVASARYRAGIPALYLRAHGYASRFVSRHDVDALLHQPDVLIFVKSFSIDDLAYAKRAHAFGIPVIVDLCDNIFVPGYSSFGANAEVFREICDLAAAVVVTGTALADVVRCHVSRHTHVVVIPDAVEWISDAARIKRAMCYSQVRSRIVDLFRSPRSMTELYGPVPFSSARLIGVIARSAGRRMLGPRGAHRVRAAVKFAPVIQRRLLEEGPTWVVRGVLKRLRGRSNRLQPRQRLATTPAALAGGARSEPFAETQLRSAAKAPETLESPQSLASAVSALRPAYAAQRNGPIRTLLWFGNSGAQYAKFGLEDLAELRDPLVALASLHRLRLVVVSNSRERYNDLIEPWPIQTQYVEWKIGVTEKLLRESEVVLIPNSLDDFSICKSANRALLALSYGVPVVATATPALEPLRSCVLLDDWYAGIDRYLTEPELVKNHVAVASEILSTNYSGAEIARRWDELLSAALAKTPAVVDTFVGKDGESRVSQ